jgi:hypothetical protein
MPPLTSIDVLEKEKDISSFEIESRFFEFFLIREPPNSGFRRFSIKKIRRKEKIRG